MAAIPTLRCESDASAPALPLRSGSVTRLEDVVRLAPAWDSLRQPQPTPMQTSAWSLACLEAFAQLGQPEFLVEAEANQLRAIAPLFAPHSCWAHCRELIGVDLLTEPMDFVYADEAGLQDLVGRLVQRGRPFYLPRVPADSPTLPALRRACAGRALIVVRPQLPYPFIPLSPAWREPEAQITSRRRSDLRRARRRAEQIGPVTCEVASPELVELDRLLVEAWTIEARSWKGATGTAVAQDPLRAPFYQHYARRACEQGLLRLCWLRFGDTTVAVQYAVEAHQRFWLFKIGYDEQWARCSPGNLLIGETLRYAAERGLASYEFLGTSADWTRVWTEQEHASVSVRVYPFGLSGLGALAFDLIARSWRAFQQTLIFRKSLHLSLDGGSLTG